MLHNSRILIVGFILAVVVIVGGALVLSKTGIIRSKQSVSESPKPVSQQTSSTSRSASVKTFRGQIGNISDTTFSLKTSSATIFHFTKDSSVANTLAEVKNDQDVNVLVDAYYNSKTKNWIAMRVTINRL